MTRTTTINLLGIATVAAIAVLAIVLAIAVEPAAALAGWSTPAALSPSTSSPYAAPAVAVDSRGDAAVAWETVTSQPPASKSKGCALTPAKTSCYPIAAVHVAVRTYKGTRVVRSVWQQRTNPSMRLSVVISPSEVTVAWGVYDIHSESEIARATYGPLLGRWSAPRTLGYFSDLYVTGGRTPWYPQLGISPQGTVLAAWDGCASTSHCTGNSGVKLAWRSPHHSFGSVQRVSNAPDGALPQFDRAGRAYLSSHCSARVLSTKPGQRSFNTAATLTGGAVRDLALGISGAGEGLASWVASACSTDAAAGPADAPVRVSTLHAGAFGPAQTLTAAGAVASDSRSVAVPRGGIVSWYAPWPAPVPATVVVGPAPVPPAGTYPLVADGGGDVVVTYGPVAAHPATQLLLPAAGGAAQPAPGPGGYAAAAPYGRAAAHIWQKPGAPLRLSVWRP